MVQRVHQDRETMSSDNRQQTVLVSAGKLSIDQYLLRVAEFEVAGVTISAVSDSAMIF